jgi:putative inorganic carbon (HCO3(-)) transporter
LQAQAWALAAAFAGTASAVGLVAGMDPKLAIGASLTVGFLVLSLVSLCAGLTAFTVLAFLEFLLPSGSVLSFTKLAGLVLVISWIAKASAPRARETFLSAHPAASFLLIAFLAWGAISIFWSESHSGTLLDVSRYLLVMVLLVIEYSAVETRTHVKWILGAFLLGTGVTAAYALVTKPTAAPDELVRLSSTVGNANVLATVLVAGVVLAGAAVIISKRSPGLRLAAIGVAVLSLASFAFTGSRSGVVSLAVVLVVTIVVAGRWRPQALVGSIAVAIASIFVFLAFAPAPIRARVAEATPGQVPLTEGRFTLWQVAWRMVEDQPVRGVGLGSFQESSVHYVLEPGTLERTDQVVDQPQVAHNIFLQTFAETGIVGEVLFLGVLGFPLGCALAAARNFERLGDDEMEIVARGLFVALVGILTADFFASEQFNKLLWLLLGLGPAMLAISRAAVEPRNPRAPDAPT